MLRIVIKRETPRSIDSGLTKWCDVGSVVASFPECVTTQTHTQNAGHKEQRECNNSLNPWTLLCVNKDRNPTHQERVVIVHNQNADMSNLNYLVQGFQR